MSPRRDLRPRGLVVALAFAVCLGCAGWEDFDPPAQRDIRDGPGLFSGDDGEFAVEMDVRRKDEADEDADPETEKDADEQNQEPAEPAKAP
jgi:hypothetical protein